MEKNRIYNFLILVLLYIAFACFPFNLVFPNSNVACLLSRILVQIAFLFTSFFIVKFKSDFNLKLNKRNFKMVFILLPTILVTSSNFLYLAFVPSDLFNNYDSELLLEILLTIFVVLNEEFIFRMLLINNLEKYSNLKKILISSCLFAVCHLSVFLSTFNVYDLIIPVYTFAFGILLAIIFVETNSIEMCIIFHFLFNLINSILFEMVVPKVSNIGFYFLANIIVVVLVTAYLLIVLKIRFSEKKKVIK